MGEIANDGHEALLIHISTLLVTCTGN